MNSAKQIGVEPVISSHEMADTEVDHLGVMAYAAWFEHLRPKAPVIQAKPPSPPPVVRVPTPPPVQRTPPSQQISLVSGQNQAGIGSTVSIASSYTKQSKWRIETLTLCQSCLPLQ